MANLRDQVIEIATQRFDAALPPAAQSYVDEVGQSILTYTNLETVPDGLLYVWVSMLVDCWRWLTAVRNNASTGTGEGDTEPSSPVPTFVSSVTEGDVTVAMSQTNKSTADNPANAHDMRGALDQIVMNYANQLNRFRTVLY